MSEIKNHGASSRLRELYGSKEGQAGNPAEQAHESAANFWDGWNGGTTLVRVFTQLFPRTYTVGQWILIPSSVMSHLTFPPPALSTHNLLLLILNARSQRAPKSKRSSVLVQNPFPPSERSLPIEFQIRRHQLWLFSLFPFCLCFLSSAPPSPLPPPLNRHSSPLLHPAPQTLHRNSGRASSELRAATEVYSSFNCPFLCPPSSSASSSSGSPSLKVQIQTQGQLLALSSSNSQKHLVPVLELDSAPGWRTAPYRSRMSGTAPGRARPALA